MAAFVTYLGYALVALLGPVILASQSPTALLRRRYVIAAAAAILAGLFTGYVAQLEAFWGQGKDFAPTATLMEIGDRLTGFMLAAVLATVLYIVGNSFLGGSARAKSS